MTNNLDRIKIILVEPAGPLNVGSVARVMKNFGLKQLILVNPQCDPHSEEARRMAVHGNDILEQCQQVSSLPAALQGVTRAIATTSRLRHLSTEMESPRTVLPWLLESNTDGALIFGREDRGLSNEELNYAQHFLAIPTNPDYPSLNLAQAVAICAYELQQSRAIVPPPKPLPPAEVATLDTLESYYQHLEKTLLDIGYLYPHTAAARMEKFRRLYHRANLSQEEVALLRGILRQIDWIWQLLPSKASREKKPKDV
jgi:tRNA/rRNA methyltransferase